MKDRNMRRVSRRSATRLLSLAAAALLVACSENPTQLRPPAAPQVTAPQLSVVTAPSLTPLVEQIYVCKTGPTGTYDFTADVISGSILQQNGTDPVLRQDTDKDGHSSFSVDAGACLWIGLSGGPTRTIRVTELPHTGTQFVSTTVQQLTSGVVTTTTGLGNPVTANLSGSPLLQGAVITFINADIVPPNLTISKTADAGTVQAGSNIGFGITVSNTGAGPANNVTLSDALPSNSGLNWSIDTQPAQGSCAIAAGALSCAFGTLAAGGSVSVHLTSPTTAETCGRVDNTANAVADNNSQVSSSASLDVTCGDLQVSKTATGSYDKTYSWTLAKSVTPTSLSGTAGSNAGSSTWTVVATQTVVNNNYSVTGSITITNPNGTAVSFNVSDVLDDGTTGNVTCPSNTVGANSTITCTYTASPTGATATLNTATVTVTSGGGINGGTATAPVSFTANTHGDANVTLGDTRFSYSNSISGSSTVTFPETFPCPSDASYYDSNGNYVRVEPNTATLTGANTNLSANAQVTITCRRPATSMTATGAGFPWSATQGAPSNWFMYSPWVTTGAYRGISTTTAPAGTALIAGQIYQAGRITGTRGSTANSTSITITLNSGYLFTNISSNVMINPMSCTTAQAYVQPGQFTIKRSASSSGNSITVTGLPNTACYGVHVAVDKI